LSLQLGRSRKALGQHLQPIVQRQDGHGTAEALPGAGSKTHWSAQIVGHLQESSNLFAGIKPVRPDGELFPFAAIADVLSLNIYTNILHVL